MQDEVPRCMLFIDDIVLIDKTSEGVTKILELWRITLESMGFRISKSNIRYVYCRFSQFEKREIEISLHEVAMLKCKQFRYLDFFHKRKKL